MVKFIQGERKWETYPLSRRIFFLDIWWEGLIDLKNTFRDTTMNLENPRVSVIFPSVFKLCRLDWARWCIYKKSTPALTPYFRYIFDELFTPLPNNDNSSRSIIGFDVQEYLKCLGKPFYLVASILCSSIYIPFMEVPIGECSCIIRPSLLKLRTWIFSY